MIVVVMMAVLHTCLTVLSWYFMLYSSIRESSSWSSPPSSPKSTPSQVGAHELEEDDENEATGLYFDATAPLLAEECGVDDVSGFILEASKGWRLSPPLPLPPSYTSGDDATDDIEEEEEEVKWKDDDDDCEDDEGSCCVWSCWCWCWWCCCCVCIVSSSWLWVLLSIIHWEASSSSSSTKGDVWSVLLRPIVASNRAWSTLCLMWSTCYTTTTTTRAHADMNAWMNVYSSTQRSVRWMCGWMNECASSDSVNIGANWMK